jgi:predicted transcriptional regulator
MQGNTLPTYLRTCAHQVGITLDMKQKNQGRAIPKRYRNRRLGDFLKEIDLTQGRATGLAMIQQRLKEYAGLKKHRDTIKRYVDPLERIGWLIKTIPDKPTSPRQKYKLTEKGKDVLGSKTPVILNNDLEEV